jgi:aminomethyltransferase
MNLGSKKTPLFEEHNKLGGKMTDFAGWLMPLWYAKGQSFEHHAVRNKCGLFDICHMGEFEIKGSRSLTFLSYMLSNNIQKMSDNQAQYNFILNDEGGVIDDCILYRFDSEKWMLVVNAGNIDTNFEWLKAHVTNHVRLENVSNQIVKIDLQGPNAPSLMSKWVQREKLVGLKFFRFLSDIDIEGMKVLVSRTGYTGEIGFELYTPVECGNQLWQVLLKEGIDFDLQPCGLGARDTLRTEAGLPLHGHELRPDRVGLGHPWEFVIDCDHDFIGRKALLEQRDRLEYFVVPFIVEGRQKAMPGWEVLVDNEKAGIVLSGVTSPTLGNVPIGFAGLYLQPENNTTLLFKPRNRDGIINGKTAEIPFVKGSSRKKMGLFL